MNNAFGEKLDQGVQPPQHWLQIVSRAGHDGAANRNSPTLSWQQILHHDLRDVASFLHQQ
jgi:hypothetical protein